MKMEPLNTKKKKRELEWLRGWEEEKVKRLEYEVF